MKATKKHFKSLYEPHFYILKYGHVWSLSDIYLRETGGHFSAIRYFVENENGDSMSFDRIGFWHFVKTADDTY